MGNGGHGVRRKCRASICLTQGGVVWRVPGWVPPPSHAAHCPILPHSRSPLRRPLPTLPPDVCRVTIAVLAATLADCNRSARRQLDPHFGCGEQRHEPHSPLSTLGQPPTPGPLSTPPHVHPPPHHPMYSHPAACSCLCCTASPILSPSPFAARSRAKISDAICPLHGFLNCLVYGIGNKVCRPDQRLAHSIYLRLQLDLSWISAGVDLLVRMNPLGCARRPSSTHGGRWSRAAAMVILTARGSGTWPPSPAGCHPTGVVVQTSRVGLLSMVWCRTSTSRRSSLTMRHSRCTNGSGRESRRPSYIQRTEARARIAVKQC